MSILPIITPPFVIALALVVLFGRTGLVTGWLDACFGIPRSRWIYGLPGVTHRAAPHVLADRVHDPVRRAGAISPALEEAAQTLRASRGARVPHGDLAAAAAGARQRVPARIRREPRRLRQSDRARRQLRRAVDQDLLRRRRRAARPGPRGGARVGAARPHAARVLAAAALARPAVVRHGHRQGRRRHAGASCRAALWYSCFGIAAAWIVFTIVCYVVIFIGGFVKDIGRGDMTLTLPSLRCRASASTGRQHGLHVHRLGVEQPVHHRRRSPRSPRR